MTNKVDKRSRKIFFVNHKLFLLILLAVPLYLFNNIFIKILGTISILSIFALLMFNVFPRMAEIKISKIWLWFLMFFFYSTLMLLRTPTAKGIYSYFLQIGLLFFVTMLSTLTLNEKVINEVFKWGKLTYILLLIPSFIIALEGGRGAFGRFNFLYSPVIYKLMLPCTFFFIARSEKKLFKILFFSFIYMRMVERTSAIVLVIIYVIYLLLRKIKNSRKLYKMLFITTFVGIVGFVYLYVQLQYTNLGYSLNVLFRQYTGGNFFSGRNYIWQAMFNYIKEKPFIGYGIDNGVLRLAGITKSSHSTYIHLLLQGGIGGLFIFFMFMYSIWTRLFNYLDDDIVITSASYLIGILAFINFEVTLIGNSTVTAIFMWFVLGIGLIQTNNLTTKEISDSEHTQ